MGMEWATKNIIISICILIIKCGHRHRLFILCSNPIYNHRRRRHHCRHLNTNVLILCLLIPLNILILILIPFTHNHPENQIVRQFQNLIHVL
ncbi:uncharacterized protein N7496_005603 [Penicillium cataractarum]|uniref:Uncharacterized protein n=1 Tax=Penicillium cataractarum TaxID=2100454 RepID=A0A9W9SI75_9EURO|nr:uncharacterized protein N7496_005603 [Penicillium cataractarum]KAJ5378194.1 hypothetical protein N7496_005603 [Penicillium cataractarum]